MSKVWLWLAIIVTVVVGLPSGVRMAYVYGTAEELTVKVNRTERITDQDGKGSRYLIFTEKETFENTDSFWYFKFNSSDLYGRIETGKEYKILVSGIRIKFLSWYRNVIVINPKDQQ